MGNYCKGKCIFCGTRRNTRKNFTPEEVSKVIKNTFDGHDSVHFENADFFYNIEEAENILDALIADPFLRQIPKLIVGRVDEVMQDGIFVKAAKAGVKVIAYGIESFDDRVLKRIGKGTTSTENIRAIENTLAAGMKPGLNLILYTPWDTIDSTLKTIEKSIQYVERGAYINVGPYILIGYGRPIEKRKDLIDYEVVNAPGLKTPFVFPRKARVLDADLDRIAKIAMGELAVLEKNFYEKTPRWVESSSTIYALLVFQSFLLALKNQGGAFKTAAVTDLLGRVESSLGQILQVEADSMLESSDPDAMGIVEDTASPALGLTSQMVLRTENRQNIILTLDDSNLHVSLDRTLPSVLRYVLGMPGENGTAIPIGEVVLHIDFNDHVVSGDLNYSAPGRSNAFISRVIDHFIDSARKNPVEVLLNKEVLARRSSIKGLEAIKRVYRAGRKIVDHGQLSLSGDPMVRETGGIDIQNIDVAHKNGSAKIRFNEDALRAVLQDGFNGFTPVIINITPVESPLMILGVYQPEPIDAST
ncbi:MAG: radical SAM protein [Candidatus Omnitrophica bacterium]|nr:radical SAM protein [Candidatus Omnitrophota bacterium]